MILTLECLEDRTVPSTAGSPWGIPWPNSNVSLSFVPDGTPLASAVGGIITSNLFATFNAKFGSTALWENQILKAARPRSHPAGTAPHHCAQWRTTQVSTPHW